MPLIRPTQGLTLSPIGRSLERQSRQQNTSSVHNHWHLTQLTRLSLALLCAYESPSWAQQAPETPVVKVAETKEAPKADVKKDPKAANKPEAVQKVEINGAKGYDERRQDTASKIVVTQEEILRYGDTSIGDVLKRLPGVTVGGVQGRGGAIRFRGLGNGYTQILLNGEPSPPGFSLDSLSPDLIERIEIIRGANAELSNQAIAGAINIVLRKAIQTAQREVKLGAQHENGEFGGTASLQFSDKLGALSYSISGNLVRGNFDRPSSGDRLGNDANGQVISSSHTDASNVGAFTGIGLAPRVNWNIGAGDTLTSQSFLNANRFNGNASEHEVTTLGAFPPYTFDNQRVKSEAVSARTNINWVHKLADSAKLDVKVGLDYNHRSSDVSLLGFDENNQPDLQRTANSASSDKGFTWVGKYSAPFVTDHSIVVGWDGAYSKRNDSRLQEDVTEGRLRPINLDENFDANVLRLAVYAQDEWAVSKQWSVYFGLRWEGLTTRSSGSDYDTVKNNSSVWSPVLQTLWKLPDSKNDQVRFGISRTYKAPSTNSLIPRRVISNNNTATSPDSIGNPNLKPELAWGVDTAFEHFLKDGGLLSANVYFRHIDDITRTILTFANGLYTNTPSNVGIANSYGLELEAKFPLRSVLKDAPNIEFRSNLSFNFSRLNTVPGPNNRLDSQTPVSANLGLDYKFDTIPFTVGGNFNFTNAGLVTISETQTSYATPKRVVDVYGLWKFSPKTSLRLSAGNVLGQDNFGANTFHNNVGSLVQSTTTPTYVAVRALLESKF
jgi:outer membrane receptor protein involved in Fe transport